MMPKSFDSWWLDQTNSIEDESHIKKEQGVVVDHVKEIRTKAFKFAWMSEGTPKDGDGVVTFFETYLRYLAGLELSRDYENIRMMYMYDWDSEMLKFYERWKEDLGIK
jgi:hypothetical protein